MIKYFHILIAVGLIVLLPSCSPKRYITKDYSKLAKSHQTIAVLPYENIYTGRTPKELTKEDIITLSEEEAVLFQRSLYFQLLEESRGRKDGDISVSIQNIDDTNYILDSNGISIKESWKKSPTELAQLLGVDAVVKVDMHKNYWLTAEESAIVGVATSLVNVNIPGVYSHRLNRTSEIYINANLIDGKEGVSLWAWNKKMDTNWQCETDEVISRINNKISKRFPYRKGL